MKLYKLSFIALSACIAFAPNAFSENSEKESSYSFFKKEEIINIKKAIENAGKDFQTYSILRIDLDHEKGQLVYEINILEGNDLFKIILNPYTGDILKKDKYPWKGYYSKLIYSERFKDLTTEKLFQLIDSVEEKTKGRVESLKWDDSWAGSQRIDYIEMDIRFMDGKKNEVKVHPQTREIYPDLND